MAAPAEAQNQARGGRLLGSVSDARGEPVKGASVTLANPGFNRSVTITTGDDGRFAMIGLQGGRWVLTIEAPGFHLVQGPVWLRGSGKAGRSR